MLIKLKNWVDRFHGSESGAVLLLVLAAFLVLFMVAMTIFDSGKAAQDKMRVQVAADTAAYSHSVIKSRTMNVIVYANIIKRMFYSYFVTYVHAWIAILAEMVIKAAECADWVLTSCWDFVAALPMVIAEGIEAIENVKDLMLNGRASKEINQLDRYSAYMYAITPWWAWIEATGRSMGNGAMVSASWPPPPSSIGNIKNAVTTTSSTVDWALGTSFTAMMPSLSQATDALPVTRRDRQKVWEAKLEPFKFDWSQGAAAAGVGYCAEYAFSMELLLTSAQTYIKSKDQPKGWKTIFAVAQVLPVIGCAAASLAYHNDGYLDWRINKNLGEDKNKWLQATSNISIAYKPRAGTMADSGGRSKLSYTKRDHKDNPLYGNEGYFALARSELVYKQPFEILATGGLSFLTAIPGVSGRLGLQNNPDMWSPRWKAKNRPIALPGEKLGSSVQGPDAGLGTIINDTIPFLIVGSILGIIDPDFTAGSGLKDLEYIYRVGTSMGPDQFEGLVK